MNIEPRKRATLSRVVRHGGVALIAAWSLLAFLAYSATSAVSGWLARMPAADGWLAWGGEILSQAAAPIIGVVWFAGALAIFGLMAVLRRSIG